jgi:hypothetical protein
MLNSNWGSGCVHSHPMSADMGWLEQLATAHSVVGISDAILRKYSTKHAPRTISDSGGL